jgi:hypothetical protein
MEESRDQIAVLLHQEQHQYACPDYAHERPTNAVPASLDFMNMLEECANVVNDRSFSPNDSAEWVPPITKVPSAVCVRQLMEPVAAVAETTNRPLLQPNKCSTGLAQWWPGSEWTEKLSP